jgi:hypothetical protein
MKKIALVTLLLFSLFGRSEAEVHSSKSPSKKETCQMFPIKNGNPAVKKSAISTMPTNLHPTILEIAEKMLGESSRYIPGCDSGRLACAAMVTRVLNLAGITDVGSKCTSDLNRQLSFSRHFEKIKIKDALPGDIIISPSNGHKYGHVGVVGKNGKVYSNNSALRRFDSVFTLPIWQIYFMKKDLEVIIYRRI